MINSTPFLRTVACSGRTLARSPPSLSFSAEGSEFEVTGLTALKIRDFPSWPEGGRANAAASPPRAAARAGRAQQSRGHSVPAVRLQRYETDTRWDDILCGHRTKNSCCNKSANRIPPQEFKEDILYWIAHTLLPGNWSARLYFFDTCQCMVILFPCWPHGPGALLATYSGVTSYVASAFLVGSLGDRICKNTWVCYPEHVIHNKTTKTRTECLKLKIKHIMILFSFV